MSPLNHSSEANDAERWCSDTAFVRALAGQLVADGHTADDVMQDAWLHALRGSAPRGSFRAWIAAIVRNVAASHHRRSQRCQRHEHAAAANAAVCVGDASAVHARLEAHALLVAAVRTLDEPYRTAIVLRYFEGLSPRAIAARRGLPVRTVHTHLQRGLSHLRARLAHRDPRWASLMLVTALPGPAAAIAMTTTSTKLTVLGGIAAAALFAFGWHMLASDVDQSLGDAEPPPAAIAATTPNTQHPVSDLIVRREATPASAAGSAATQPADAPNPWTVRGILISLDGTPLPRLRVALTAFGQEQASARASTDDAGGFAITVPDVMGGHVEVDDEAWTTAYRPVLWGTRDVALLTVVAAPVAAVNGIVTDDQGTPLAGVEVTLSADLPPRSAFARSLEQAMPGEWRTTSKADGTFVLARAPQVPALHVHGRATGYSSAHTAVTSRHHVHLQLQRAPVLIGRVVDELGKPVAAAVFCHPAGTMAGPDGRFEIDLSNVSSPWLVASVQGQLPARLKCENGPPTDPRSWPQPVELRLGGTPLTISGRALATDGTPLASPHVTLLDAECLIPGNEMSSIEFLARVSARVTQDGAEFSDFGGFHFDGQPSTGAFELRGLQPRSYRLRLECRETCQWVETAPIAAGTTGIELRLPAEPLSATVAGVVVDRRGAPVAGASVWMERIDPATNEARTTPTLSTDANGRFTHGPLACAARTLCVQTEGIAHPTKFDLAMLGEVANLRLVAPVKTSVRITTAHYADSGAFLDAAEQPVAATVTHGNVAWGAFDVSLVNGASEVITVPDNAATLVLRKEGREVTRCRLDLRPGELQVLRP